MHSNHKEKRPVNRFALGMVIYAAVFLLMLNFGLLKFWDYMDAYESSRPKQAVQAYMETLTPDRVADLSADLIDQVDHNIQTEAQCRQYIKDAVGKITYAKKSTESTDTRQVFVVRSGSAVIGEFSIKALNPDKYGFTCWELEDESIDVRVLDLFGEPCSVTVPQDHTVAVNGYTLDSTYVTDAKIPYEPVAEFYDDYDLPYRVSYAVTPIMGQMDVVITDPEGNVVTFDESTDWTPYFHNCTEEEIKALDEFSKIFVERYVAFTGSRKTNRYANFNKLKSHIDADSELIARLRDAIEGLEFGQSQGDKVASLVANHQVRLDKTHYLCDITYEVDTTGRKGVVRTTTNAKLVVVQTDKGLKVKSMNIY